MKTTASWLMALSWGVALAALAQPDAFPPGGERDLDGPPAFGPGGFGPGGPGGMMQETKLVKQFDQNGDGWLNAAERKAAREFLSKQGNNRRAGGPGGRRGGFGGRGENQTMPQPGAKLSPADVKSYPDAPLYASNVVRTVFLEFENADWEKELAEFKNTDVEVPAKVIVDGKTYRDVGVHFHGMSSFMMVGEGQKRSLVLDLNFIHEDQQLDGVRKLSLLNSHEDPSFLHTVLSLQIARDYLPAPKANFVRVVINGESWGIYVNQQHFSKEFVKADFGSAKGARWKVPGSPNGRGGLNYLGDNPADYKRVYELKSKDDPQSWANLINLCKVLNETPADQLEKALSPVLDIDGALRFLAWENVLANGDGFWTRASDYEMYEDAKGRFHIVPYDANETFSAGGGPGGPGGPGGGGGFGPGMIVAEQLLDQGDKNNDGKLSKEEFATVVMEWFSKLDVDKAGKLTEEQFMANLATILPPPPGFGPPGGGQPNGGPQQGGGPRGFGPAMFIGPALFQAAETNKDGSLTGEEFKGAFAGWFSSWDKTKSGVLTEVELREGLNTLLPPPNFGRGGGMAGPGGGRGRGGPGGGGPGGGGVSLDPLVAASDASKPLLSKLLAVPALRTRYLVYVHDMAEKWLDWKQLGPLAQQYHDLIAEDVKADTRKLDSTEAFLNSVSSDSQAEPGRRRGPTSVSLKVFAEKRREFLLNHAGVKQAVQTAKPEAKL